MQRTEWLRALAAAALVPALLAGCSSEPEPIADDAPGEWRQWRGQNAQGVSEERALPVRWSNDSSNLRWRSPIPGFGNSSPIVSRGKVFLTTSWGPDKYGATYRNQPLNRALIALDLASGEVLWERVVFTTGQERRHHLNTPAAVTPAADGERVYVYFGMGLAAYDYDGELVWSQEVDPNYIERARYGVVSSPIVVGDAVIVVRDDEWGGDEVHDISWLAAYDKRTGRELWRHENDETCCSYATPILRDTSAGTEIIFPSTPFIAAYDPGSGERLWTAEHTLRQVVPTALLSDNLLILPGSVHMRSIAAWRLEGEGAATRALPLWTSKRAVPKIPTPVLLDGRLIAITDNGIVAAFDLQTGKPAWQKRLRGGNYHSSLLAAGDRIYATSVGCQTAVLRPDGRQIATSQIEGNCEASPAVAEGALLIRTSTELVCIEKFRRPQGEDAGAVEPEKKKKKKRKKERKKAGAATKTTA